MEKPELYKKLQNAVVEFDEDGVKTLCEQSLTLGFDPVETILDGVAAGMLEVGKLFEKQEYFVPEVLMCADALNIGLDVLTPHVPKETKETKGTIILGTVQGDVHDIGKNLVKLMLDVNGFTVHDLGKDVPLEQFVAKQEETGAEIIALSSMMTTTMMGMKKVVQMVKEKDIKVAILLGGAPVSRKVMDLFGADGCASSAMGAVEEAVRLSAMIRAQRAV
ncbi:MAG: cobalamin-dependent protein [Pseudomonadota bacterium]